MSMQWRIVDDYHCISDCGEYRVAKVFIAGTMFYEAWHQRTFLARGEDPDSANMRRVCEQHKVRVPAVELHENNDGQ